MAWQPYAAKVTHELERYDPGITECCNFSESSEYLMHCSCDCRFWDSCWVCCLNFRIRHPLNPSIIFHVTVLSLECPCHMPERKMLPVATHCPHFKSTLTINTK